MQVYRVQYRRKQKSTFAISSPEEFLVACRMLCAIAMGQITRWFMIYRCSGRDHYYRAMNEVTEGRMPEY